MSMAITIALAGNPNVGKSTLFNALTGSRQHVGNWPGKTVEKKEGRLHLQDQDVLIVDLPGTYSLTAYSIEEIISRDFIINEHPKAVIAVVDSANLERNLYLVTQLIELQVPIILVLNMTDIARNRGVSVDIARLSGRLNNIPIIETIGSSGVGIETLKSAIAQLNTAQAPIQITYHEMLETEITHLVVRIHTIPELTQHYVPRWLAIKLLEADSDICARCAEYPDIVAYAQSASEKIESRTGDDPETHITDGRYQFIQTILNGVITRPAEKLETTSDKIDHILTHRIFGVPIFLFLMWVVFQLTANVSAPFLDWVDGVIAGPISTWVISVLTAIGLGETWVESLMVDGIVAGVGGVLVFVPVLMALYMAIGILEDSGYMARVAFVMDRVMRMMGLHGKSFLPMLVGFGCTVPAVYATRTLENEDDRKLTGFLVTFMSCGARLPVYVVIGAAFFGARSGNLIFGMYLLGIVVALLTGWGLKRTVYRNKPPQPFVMELPPYRLPNLRGVWRQTWERTSSFVRKAGTIILATSVIVWILLAIPVRGDGNFNDVAPADSLFGSVSGVISPIFTPAGFGDWQATGSLITGLVAKEVVIGTMSQIYVGEAETPEEETPIPTFGDDVAYIGTSFVDATILTAQEIVNIIPRTLNIIPLINMPEADFLGAEADEEDTTTLESALTQVFTPLSALAFTVFVLLYTPCMTTVAAMRHEFGMRFTLYQVAYTFVVAWIAAVMVYQIGMLIGWGG